MRPFYGKMPSLRPTLDDTLPALEASAPPAREPLVRTRPAVLLGLHEAFVSAGARFLLEQDGFAVAAVVADAGEAIAAARETRPDVCLLAQELPGDVLHATREIVRAAPRTAVVVLGRTVDRRAVLDALRAGAVGYLLESVAASSLPEALRSAMRGEAVISRRLVTAMLDALTEGHLRHADLPDGRVVELTEREWEVARLLARRAATSEIAAALGISSVTVRRHLSGLMRKLGVGSRDEAARLLRHAVGAGV
jgi:DNA-binding NarL/FixJ family response regulator